MTSSFVFVVMIFKYKSKFVLNLHMQQLNNAISYGDHVSQGNDFLSGFINKSKEVNLKLSSLLCDELFIEFGSLIEWSFEK